MLPGFPQLFAIFTCKNTLIHGMLNELLTKGRPIGKYDENKQNAKRATSAIKHAELL